MSVIAGCVLLVGVAAQRMAVAAAAATAAAETTGMGTNPLLTEIAAAGMEDAVTAPALAPTTSTRITAAPGVAPAQQATLWGRPHLLHQALSL